MTTNKGALKTTKKGAPKTVKVPPSGGQSGPALDLGWQDLSKRERIVLTVIVEYTLAGGVATLSAIAMTVLRNTGTDSTSTIRNQLRRLARAGLFTRFAAGAYQATSKAVAMVKAQTKAVA